MNTILSSGISSIIQAISYKIIIASGVSTSTLSPADLPPALNINTANLLLNSTTVDQITVTFFVTHFFDYILTK